MRTGIRLVVVVTAVLAFVPALHAQRSDEARTVVALGTAAVGTNVAAAREAAIQAALMQAVALVAADLLTPEGFAESFRRLNESLLDRPDTFVQGFRVLSEAVAGKQHRVLVQATVPVKPIQEVASRLVPSAPSPPAAGPLSLTIEGTGNLAASIKFRRALAATPGVDAVQIREVKANATTLSVSYRGAPEDLVRALTGQSFDTFSVTVVDPDPAALKLTLVPK